MDFLTLVTQWIDAQIAHYESRIAQRRENYRERNWRWTDDAVRDFINRIAELRTLRDGMVNAITLNRAHGNNLLILANIVHNEAGVYGLNAKVAVAYAWLNRTGNNVREPVGAEISEYVPLLTRWNNLGDEQRLTFLRHFPGSVAAARQRLVDQTPGRNDPTNGATHWVSPLGLPDFNNQRGRYSRTLGRARNRAFPNWARAATDPQVAQMQRRGQLGTNYAEITVAGVAQDEFLFYTGVR
jgi:hypothetical protein